MRITSLNATDVLSFSSLSIEFQAGLNAIVGPNGAGKSNVLRLVSLIRRALDAALGVPNAGIHVQQYLRIGAESRRGMLSLGVELTDEVEQSLVVGFVRALLASSMDRNAKTVESPSVDCAFEQLLAARVRQTVTLAEADSLLRGRLVLWLDAGPPEAISFAYEFDHEGTTFRYGITGAGVPSNWVAVATGIPSLRTSWSGQPLDLSRFLTGTETARFDFRELLPGERPVPWDVKAHPSGRHLLLSEELARSLAIDPARNRNLLFTDVLYRAVHDRLVLTENLRRPPRTVYELTEASVPPSLEDAGDLPLELYRQKVSEEPEDRRGFQAVRRLFKDLTRDEFDVTARISPHSTGGSAWFVPQLISPSEYPPTMMFQQVSVPPTYSLHIEAVVAVGDGQVPVQRAGAGVWEALVASALAVRVPGRVLLLDEPAVNLHPSWQRRLLSQLASLDQVILITHSPYLVPASKVEDLRRITRLLPTPAGTATADLRNPAIPDEWLHRWRQDLATSADARAALFARGVVLLEGDTDYGAFSTWFSNPLVVGSDNNTYDALNLSLITAGSDRSFGAWVSYLRTLAIPWIIICDGPVLSPEREVSLLHQLTEARLDLGPVPDTRAPFEEWKAFWERHGVFTVANRFGGVKNERDKSGEIEAFFARMDHRRWGETCQRYPKSKVRAGYVFAEEANLADHPDQLRELQRLWSAIVARLSE